MITGPARPATTMQRQRDRSRTPCRKMGALRIRPQLLRPRWAEALRHAISTFASCDDKPEFLEHFEGLEMTVRSTRDGDFDLVIAPMNAT